MKKFLLLFLFLGSFCATYAQQPVFSSNPSTTATVGQLYKYVVGVSDPAYSNITLTAPTLPAWLTLKPASLTNVVAGTGINSVAAVAVDQNDNLYLTAYDFNIPDDNIYKIDVNGNVTVFATHVAGNCLNMLVIGNDLYLAYSDDAVSGYIRKMSLSNPGAGETIVLSGTSIAALAERNGDLYASAFNDQKVLKIDLTTNQATDFVTGINGSPFGLGFTQSGNLLIADFNGTNVWSWNGSTLTTVINDLSGGSGTDIKRDLAGNIYITTIGSEVRKYTPDLSSYVDIINQNNLSSYEGAINSKGEYFFTNSTSGQVLKIQALPLLSGTPAAANLGVNPVSLQASNGQTTNQNFNITVGNPVAQNNALAFNGTSGNDITVNAPASAFNFGTGDFTLQAWINTTDAPGGNKVFLGNSGSGDYWLGMNNQGKPVFSINGGGVTGTTSINDGKWHQVTGVRINNQISIYVDGISEGTNANASSVNPNSTFTIGNFSHNNGYPWLGKIDEVRVYNSGLSAANILADMTSTTAALPASLVAHFNMNTGQAGGNNAGLTTLTDLSSNAFTATLQNFDLSAGNTTSNYVGSYALVVPTAIAATAIGSDAFTANWTAPSNGSADSYRLDIASNVNFTSNLQTLSVASGTSRVVNGLSFGNTYYYRVRAFSNTLGEGASSNPIQVSTAMSPPGNALNFTGTESVSLANGPVLSSNFTQEAWIYPTLTDGGFHGIMGNLQVDGTQRPPSLYVYNYTHVHGGFGDGTNWNFYTTGSVLTPNAWNHVAQTYDGTTLTLYVNGAVAYSTAGFAGRVPLNTPVSSFGQTDNFFQGSIDEIRMWDVTRTAQEIADNYKNTIATAPNLIAYYNFDQGVGGGNNTEILSLRNTTAPANYKGTLNGFAKTGTTSNFVGSFAATLTAPVAADATTISASQFTANWSAVANTTAYFLDVATDAAFANPVTGYNNLNVGNTTSVSIPGLSPFTAYYYRVRSNSEYDGTSVSSNVIQTTTFRNAPSGNALHFNKATQDVVTINSGNFPSGNSSYTIEAWVNPDNLANIQDGGIIGWGNYGAVNEVNALRFGGGPGNYIIHHYWWANDLSAPIPDISGTWIHVAATFDQPTGVRSIYVNGQLIVSDNPSQAGHNVPSTNITIGKTVGTEFITGKLDEVRVYNSALSLANIQADMNNTTPSVPGNLVAYYNFDQGIAGGNNTAIVSLRNTNPSVNKGTLQNFVRTGNTSNFVGANNYPMEVPVIANASNVTDVSFSANWNTTTTILAEYYLLDVATDAGFTNILPAYNNKSITALTESITGLTSGATYYYRVRAFSEYDGLSANSSTATVTLKTTSAISFNSPNATKTYGDADFAVGASSNNANVPITYTSSDPTVATVAANGTVHIVAAGTTTITANQAGDANYTAANPASQVITINKKALTITATAINKVYDATDAATVTLQDNRVAADVFTVSYTGAIFDNKNTGTGKTVTISGISIPAGAAANYTYNTSATTTASITPKSLSVTATGIDKVYNGNTLAFVNFIDDHLGTDVINLNAAANFVDKNVGVGKVVNVTSITVSGPDGNNYTPNTSTATTASIAVSAITVTATAGQTKVYGAVNPVYAYTTNVSPFAGDTFTGTLNRAAGENVGSYAIGLGTLTLGSNYAITYSGSNFAITAKPITVLADAKTKQYGSADPALTYTTNVPLIGTDAFTGALSRTAGENVGTYAINKNTLALSSNYTVSYTGANLSITTKALTIAADNKTKVQGTANPALTVTYTGFITGENNTALLTQPVLTTTATTASPQGTYPIVVNGATSNNYTITQVNGILTVTPGTPTSLTLAAAQLLENRPAGTTAGSFASTADDPGATFTYTLVAGAGSTDNAAFSISGNTLLTAQSFDFETKNNYSIRVRTTTQYGLSLENTFTVNISDVNEVPTLNAITDQAICYTTGTQTVALSGITAGPETAQTTTISVSSNNPDLFATLAVSKSGTTGTLSYSAKTGASGTATVTVTVQDNGGTANGGTDTYTRTFTVTINALPTPAISSNKGNSVGKGETIQLTATGGTSYVWATNSSIIGGQNTAVLTVRPSVTTTYTVTATNANGCSESTSFTIAVESDYTKLKSTNLLTPNNDGINDKWVITNIDLYGNNEAKVFDVAGRLVYSKRNYDNSWDGTFNGSPLSEGTYYYVVDFGADKGKLKGFITIIREQ